MFKVGIPYREFEVGHLKKGFITHLGMTYSHQDRGPEIFIDNCEKSLEATTRILAQPAPIALI